jgi:ubiquitin C-terminal hydrolase
MFEFDKWKAYNNDFYSRGREDDEDEGPVKLTECFEEFSKKEELEAGNEWYCPCCKKHFQATKQMTIYKAPEILILHLKRFKNKGTFRGEKNTRKVFIPLELNLQGNCVDPTPMSTYVDQLAKMGK